MNTIRKIQWYSAFWQLHNVTFWGKDEYFPCKDIQFQSVKQFFRIACILPLKNMTNPAYLCIKISFCFPFITFLISPMGGYTIFRHTMHIPSTNLNFYRLTFCADDGGVQGLIHIRLRHRNIIFKAIRQRFPQTMYCT